MERETDSAVVGRAQRGDPAARETLARRYFPAAYAVALALTRHPPDAEDVAQEALLVALQRLEQCKEPARFTSWLLASVRHRALHHLEKNKTRTTLSGNPMPDGAQSDPLSDASIDWGRRRALLSALESLSATQREVFLLHDLESWTHGEISTVLEMSQEMSRQHLFIARRLMREKLAQGGLKESRHG
jgi:RNA polymerase sigma-70 factor, ECF subfamily